MMQLICLFSPAFLAVAILQKIRKEPLRNWDFAFTFAIFAGVINMLSTAVLALLFRHPEAVLSDSGFSASLVFKYLALSFVFALVTPYLYDVLRQTVKIELSIRVDREALMKLAENREECPPDGSGEAEEHA